jgi:septum formation protein
MLASAMLCSAAAATAPPLVPSLSAPLVLGSGSKTRAAILRELQLPFEVHKPDIDEKSIRRSDPAELVLAIGRAKAAALMDGDRGAAFRASGALILTADQVVVCGDQVLEKPETEAEARHFLAKHAVTPPQTVGSCVVSDPVSGQQWAAVDTCRLKFDPFPDSTVDALIAEGDLFQCAGGLMIEHPLVQPHVRHMEGTIDAVMGLCKATTLRLLAEANAARA